MNKKIKIFVILTIEISLLLPVVNAHVPYLEHKDFTEENPFMVKKSIFQSIAVYSWLETDFVNPCEDFDVYEFKVRIPNTRIYANLIGPVCGGFYENFVPWFALVGPGLPDPGSEFPFDLPDGYGAIIKENVEPGEPRETFYEPFGGKEYYDGPTIDEKFEKTGTYYVYVWDPHEIGGDYTLALGKYEIWLPLDILRALIYTPLIRLGFELHLPLNGSMI